MATKKKRTEQSSEGGKPSVAVPTTVSTIGGKGGRPPEISSVLVNDLLKPLLGQKGAHLTLALNGDISDEKLDVVKTFVHKAKANAKLELTIPLEDKTADFTALVNGFLDRLHDETARFTVCARCGDTGWKPPKNPGKPGGPKGPGKDKAPAKPKDA